MAGTLKVFIGPMKSGKSARLIAEASPYSHSGNHRIAVIQPATNVRDGNMVSSRNGSSFRGSNTMLVQEFPLFEELEDMTVVVVEEFHFFDNTMAPVLERLLQSGISIFVAGLDMDYSGTLTERYVDILRLAPDQITYCKAVCHVCGAYNAGYTQVYNHGEPVLGGLPQVIPEDGTYQYQPVCSAHFKHS